MLFGRDYRLESKHFQGFLSGEQVEGLAGELSAEIDRASGNSANHTIFYDSRKRGFRIFSQTNLASLRLRLKPDGGDGCCNLYVKISGYGNFEYAGLLKIADTVHGEVAD